MSPAPFGRVLLSPRFPRVSGDEPEGMTGTMPRPCFPRVSGDEPMDPKKLTAIAVFSPRERG